MSATATNVPYNAKSNSPAGHLNFPLITKNKVIIFTKSRTMRQFLVTSSSAIGPNIAAVPNIRVRFVTIVPKQLPIARDIFPFLNAKRETESSGKDVPKASTTAAISDPAIPKIPAKLMRELTINFAATITTETQIIIEKRVFKISSVVDHPNLYLNGSIA